jgi:Family of unknown function (DUF6335)
MRAKKGKAKGRSGSRKPTPARPKPAARSRAKATRGTKTGQARRQPTAKASPPRARKPRARAAQRSRARGSVETERGGIVNALEERLSHPGTGPPLSGGHVDADWERAASSGEEGVGGSVATPDQDVVDEIGRALGVDQPADAPVRSSEEILRDRDRLYWHLERQAEDEQDR